MRQCAPLQVSPTTSHPPVMLTVCTQILSFPLRKLIHFLTFSPFHWCSFNNISETCSPSPQPHCWAALFISSDSKHPCPRLLQCHLLRQDGHSDCQRDDSDTAGDLGRLPGRGMDQERCETGERGVGQERCGTDRGMD